MSLMIRISMRTQRGMNFWLCSFSGRKRWLNTEGVESDLYRKIQESREKAGLSVPEFVKKILLEHFENEERGEKERSVLYEIREEYQEMAQRLEKVVSQSIRRHDVVLLEAINKMGGINLLKTDILTEGRMDARLPEISGKVPEGALDFLNQ